MSDLLLLIHGLMKIALVMGLMVLVATAPSQAHATSQGQQTVAPHAIEHEEDDEPSWGRRVIHDDDRWLEADEGSPCMNLDGTPMAGDLDIDGNFYGDCGSAHHSWD